MAGDTPVALPVSICDLGGVDAAVAKLCEHKIIGVDVLWQPETHDEYHQISVLTLSSGASAFSFQVPRESKRLPMALELLLTHPHYLKVSYKAREIKIGKLFRDFDLQILPLYDADDQIGRSLGDADLVEAYERLFPGSQFHVRSDVVQSNWANPNLNREQLEFAAFVPHAAQRTWTELAQPSGDPPHADAEPVDVRSLVRGLVCPHCSARMQSAAALEKHIRSEHYHPCSCCAFVGTSRELLQQHQTENHIRCRDCGAWISGPHAMEQHNKAAHSWQCLDGCGRMFRNESELLAHMAEAHEQCPVCGAWFIDANARDLHYDITHPTCGFCGRIFKTPKELKQHVYARVNNLCYPQEPDSDALFTSRDGRPARSPGTTGSPAPDFHRSSPSGAMHSGGGAPRSRTQSTWASRTTDPRGGLDGVRGGERGWRPHEGVVDRAGLGADSPTHGDYLQERSIVHPDAGDGEFPGALGGQADSRKGAGLNQQHTSPFRHGSGQKHGPGSAAHQHTLSPEGRHHDNDHDHDHEDNHEGNHEHNRNHHHHLRDEEHDHHHDHDEEYDHGHGQERAREDDDGHHRHGEEADQASHQLNGGQLEYDHSRDSKHRHGIDASKGSRHGPSAETSGVGAREGGAHAGDISTDLHRDDLAAPAHHAAGHRHLLCKFPAGPSGPRVNVRTQAAPPPPAHDTMESFAARTIRSSPPRTVFTKPARTGSSTSVASQASSTYRSFYSTPSKSHRLAASPTSGPTPARVSSMESTGMRTAANNTSTLSGRRTAPQPRQPQSQPGQEPWVQPPFQKVSTLKLAPTADSVGLFG